MFCCATIACDSSPHPAPPTSGLHLAALRCILILMPMALTNRPAARPLAAPLLPAAAAAAAAPPHREPSLRRVCLPLPLPLHLLPLPLYLLPLFILIHLIPRPNVFQTLCCTIYPPPSGLPPLLYGHRGSETPHPENSLPALLHGAADLSAVEFDIAQAANGFLIVLHDETLDRTTNGTGPVCRATPSYLASLALAPDTPIPSLADALAALPEARLMLDVKTCGGCAPCPTLLAGVLRHLDDARVARDRVLFTSPSAPTLKLFVGEARTALSVDLSFAFSRATKVVGVLESGGFTDAAVYVGLALARPDIVREVRRSGRRVILWTIRAAWAARVGRCVGADGWVVADANAWG